MSAPTLSKIVRTNGVAGQVQFSVAVTYDGEPSRAVAFAGQLTGGPVVMITGDTQVFVTDPDRFGPFGPEWVRRFFA